MSEGNSAHDNPLIQVQGLRLAYGDYTVLDRVEICVFLGEFWFLLGQNGTGKTTFLKALLQLLSPSAGKIDLHPDLMRSDRIGFVPQRCDLKPSVPITVREFVLLGLVGIRAGRKERKERLYWALSRVGLAAMAKRDYWSLSHGQRQRTLVARALARRPAVLIMDEPTTGLDPAAESTLLNDLVALNREERLTILCVSHDLPVAARHGSHIALFHHGGVQTGTARDVLTPDNLERVYGMGLDVIWKDDGEDLQDSVMGGVGRR